MKIKILGTRGNVKSKLPYHSKHSGVLIDDVLLLDLGEKEFLEYNPKWIFITHLHPDHAFFVTKHTSLEIPIYSPERFKGGVETKIINKEIGVGKYKINPIPTHHSKKVKSVAYLVKADDSRILYTGDMIWIDKKYHNLLGDLDLVITEASFMREGGMVRKDKETGRLYGHNGVPNLVRLFKKFTKNILFVHFGSWFYKGTKTAKRRLCESGRKNGVNVYVGYDGETLRF